MKQNTISTDSLSQQAKPQLLTNTRPPFLCILSYHDGSAINTHALFDDWLEKFQFSLGNKGLPLRHSGQVPSYQSRQEQLETYLRHCTFVVVPLWALTCTRDNARNIKRAGADKRCIFVQLPTDIEPNYEENMKFLDAYDHTIYRCTTHLEMDQSVYKIMNDVTTFSGDESTIVVRDPPIAEHRYRPRSMEGRLSPQSDRSTNYEKLDQNGSDISHHRAITRPNTGRQIRPEPGPDPRISRDVRPPHFRSAINTQTRCQEYVQEPGLVTGLPHGNYGPRKRSSASTCREQSTSDYPGIRELVECLSYAAI